MGQAGPSALSQGVDQAWSNICAAVSAALIDAELDALPRSCIELTAALAGAGSEQRAARFVAADPGFRSLNLVSDGLAALEGAFAGGPGGVVSVGTGTVGYCRLPNGALRVVSGWGFGVGDEGSGAWLGQRVVQALQHALDGRAQFGALTRAACDVIGDQRQQVYDWMSTATQKDYAGLAKYVFDLEGVDELSSKILQEACFCVEQVALALDRHQTMPLCVMGSVGERLSVRLSSSLKRRIVMPAGTAVDGAIALARSHHKD
jgi:glucosamine kinase